MPQRWGYSSTMSQVSGSSATAYGRSVWRVLRPAVVLGGFVAVWWALTTGVPHADTSPHGLANSVRHAVKAHHSSHISHSSPVRDLARRVHHDARSTSSKVVSPVRH